MTSSYHVIICFSRDECLPGTKRIEVSEDVKNLVFWAGLVLAAGLAWWFGVAEVQPWLGRDFNWAGSNDGVEVWERGVYARRPMESLKK